MNPNEPLALVPMMTGDTTPYGECISQATYSSSYYAWYAFNDDTASNKYWNGNVSSQDSYVGYKFDSPTIVTKCTFVPGTDGSGSSVQATSNELIASNDGNTWEVIGTVQNSAGSGDTCTITTDNGTAYTYYALRNKQGHGNWPGNQVIIKSLQFYGFE